MLQFCQTDRSSVWWQRQVGDPVLQPWYMYRGLRWTLDSRHLLLMEAGSGPQVDNAPQA